MANKQFNATINLTVQVSGKERIDAIAKTLNNLSNGKNLNNYWRNQQTLIDNIVNSYNELISAKNEYDYDGESHYGAELIKNFNALNALLELTKTDIESISDEFGNINVNSIKDVINELKTDSSEMMAVAEGFSKDAFKDFGVAVDTLKESSSEAVEVLERLGNVDSGGLTSLDAKINQLKADLETANDTIASLEEKLSDAEAGKGIDVLKNKISLLESSLKTAEAEMDSVRNKAKTEFSNFLKGNNLWSSKYNWGDYDGQFNDIFEKIKDGSLTAQQAIQEVKTKYASLFETGSNIDATQLRTFISTLEESCVKIEKLRTEVSSISSQIKNISSSLGIGNVVAEFTDAEKATEEESIAIDNLVSKSAGIDNVARIITSIIQSTNDATSETNELYNSISQLVSAINSLASLNLDNLKSIDNVFTALNGINSKSFSKASSENLLNLIKGLSNIQNLNTDNLRAISQLRLDGLNNLHITATPLKNLTEYLPKLSGINIDGLNQLSGIDFSKLNTLNILNDIKINKAPIDNVLRLQQLSGVDFSGITQLAGLDFSNLNSLNNLSGITINPTTISNLAQLGNISVSLNVDTQSLTNIQTQLQSLSSTPIPISVTLDANNIQSQIDGIINQLQTLSNPTPVNLDVNNVQGQIDSIITQLQSLGNAIPITLDFANVQTQINNVISQLRNIGTVDINLNANQQSINNIITQLQNLGNVIVINLDVTNAEGQIGNIITQLQSLNNPIPVNLDFGNANNSLSQIVTALSGLNSNNNITINADPQSITNIRTQLQAISNTPIPITLDATRVNSQISAIETRLRNLSRIQINLGVNGTGRNGGSGGGSFDDTFQQLLNLQRKIGNTKINIDKIVNTKEAQNQIQVLVSQMKQAEADFRTMQNVFNMSNGSFSTEEWARLQTVLDETREKLELVRAKVEDTREKLANSISLKVNDGTFNNQLNKISSDMGKIQTQSAEVTSSFSSLETAYNELVVAAQNYQNANNKSNLDILINKNKEYQEALKETKNQIDINLRTEKDANAEISLQSKKDLLSAKIDAWLKDNSAAAKQFGAELENIKAQIQGADSQTLTNLETQFKTIQSQAKAAGVATQTLGDKFKSSFSRLGTYFSGMMLFMKGIQYIKEMANNVKEVDTAMTELYRVTDLSASQYEKLYSNMTASAKEYGASLSEMINSTASWVRLGFSADTANRMAEISTMYQHVTDLDESTAVENLVTAYKGFQDQLLELTNGDESAAVEYIADIYDKMGNEFAVTAANMGEGLTNCASALDAAGNSIQESSAMLVGITEVTQNASKAGNALRTVSMRLRGTTAEELQEMGEDVDGLITATSTLQSTLSGLTNGRVNVTDSNGNLRDTFDIMRDIASIWDEIKNTNAGANLLETIAGKNRASDIAALLNNWEKVESALEAANTASGTAQAEQNKWMESLQGHLEKLQVAWQTLSNDFLSSDFLKGLVDVGTNALNIIDKIVKSLGTIPTLLTAISAGMSLKGKGLFGIKDLTLFVKSISGIKNSILSNGGLKNLISNGFNSKLISQNDINAIKAYNSQIDACVTSQTAFYRTMQQASPAAQKLVQNANGGKVSIQNLNTSLTGYIAKLVGTKAATIALQVASTALNMALTMGISVAISSLVSWLDKVIVTESELSDKVNEVTSNFEKQTKELQSNKSNFDSLAEEYIKLSRGVDSFGNNISLSSEEYNRYLEVCNQIANITPSLVTGYGEHGQAILSCKDNVEGLTQAYNDLIIAQNSAVTSEGKNIFKDFKNKYEDFQKDGLFEDDEFNIQAADALEKILNSNNIDSAIDAYASTGSDIAVRINNALKDAGLEQDMGFLGLGIDGESGHDFLKRAITEYPETVKAIVSSFKTTLSESTNGMDSLVSAYISNSLLSGDYSNIDGAIKNIFNSIMSGFDANFYAQFDNVNDLYDCLNNLLDNFNNLNDDERNSIELFIDVQTKYNNNESSITDYVNQINTLKESLSGLSEETQEQIMISLGLDDEQVTSQYEHIKDKMLNKGRGMSESQFNDFMSDKTKDDLQILYEISLKYDNTQLWTLTQWENEFLKAKSIVDESKGSMESFNALMNNSEDGGFKSTVNSKIESIQKLQEALDGVNSLSEEDRLSLAFDFPSLSPYVNDIDAFKNELQDLIDTSNEGINEYLEEQIESLGGESTEAGQAMLALKEIINDIISVSSGFNFDIDDEISKFDNLYGAMKNSVSGTGLKTEDINNIKNMFSGLEGYDASTLFERTEHGIHLNTTALRALQSEYENTKKLDIQNELQDLKQKYNQSAEAVKGLTVGSKEYYDALSSRGLDTPQSILNQIEDVQTLAAQYEGLTSSYNKWILAQSSGEEGDMYDNVTGSLEDIKKLYDEGLVGTNAFRAAVQMMTDEDLSTANIDKLISTYEAGYPAMERYFTEGQDGCINFLQDVEKLNSEWASMNEDGSWEIDFGVGNDQEIAQAISEMYGLQLSTEEVQMIMRKLSDYGFDIQLDSAYTSIDELKSRIEESEEKLRELGEEPVDIDVNCDLSDIDDEIKDAQDLIKKINEINESNVSPEVKTAQLEDATNKLDILISRKLEAQEPMFMSLSSKDVDETLSSTLTLFQQYQQAVQKEYTMSVKGDTSGLQEAQEEVDSLINEIAGLDNETLATIGINVDDSSATSKVDQIKQQIAGDNATFGVNVSADTTSAQNSIDNVNGHDVTLNATVTGNEAIDNIKTALEELPENIDIVVNAHVIGDDKVTELKESIDNLSNLSDKDINVTANVYGTTEAKDLSGAIESVNDKEVDVTAKVTGTNLVTDLAKAISGVISKSVRIIASVFGTSSVRDLKDAIGSVNSKTVSITTNKITNNITKSVTVSNGTANAQGTAFARGSWGAKSGGVALGGEVGQELVNE